VKHVVHDPENLLRIEEVWIFISRDDKGNEGVCAFMHPTLGWVPMVAADEQRLESLRPKAAEIARLTSKSVHLIKLTTRLEVEVIGNAVEH
jgi:hypothetical protein